MIARIALAVLLLAMALGQALSWSGFVDAVASYQLFVDAPAVVGALLVAGELLAGALLLAPYPARRIGAKVAFGVALTWTAIGVQAFARGLEVPNCGCFGTYLQQSLNWFVLVQDAEFVALGWWVQKKVSAAAPTAVSASGTK